MKKVATVIVAMSGLMASFAHANTINFADQPAGPSTFAATSGAQTLTYNDGGVVLTFSGGVILTNETNQSTDFSNVYATGSQSLVGGPADLTNPLVITASQSLQNFSVTILNAVAGNYQLSDNGGNSAGFNLPTTGGSAQTETFSSSGTVIDISSENNVFGTGWDFAIGQISFTCAANLAGCSSGGTPVAAAPEMDSDSAASAVTLLLGGLAVFLRRKAQ
jgi:hypothetical protein